MPRYTVTPVNRYGQKTGPSETVEKKDIPAAKARIREKIGGKQRQKFDVFSEDQVPAAPGPKPKKPASKPEKFKSTPNRNTYSVTPINKYAMKDGPTEKADGRQEIPAAKKKARNKLGVKRHKFDIYNETKQRFVDA